MEFLFSKLISMFFLIAPFFILLGVVIVIHELGHFAAAKFLGVKVEVFSVGFGKKILKYKYGDTVYCLSLFILGGYVKLFGDEPGKELSEEEKKYSFLHKPVLSKIIIAFAGPFMNFILAIFLFFVLSLFGEPYPSPKVGDIRPFSKAYEDGFRSGDLIETINNKKVNHWAQVEKMIQGNPNVELSFKVKREGSFNALQENEGSSSVGEPSALEGSVVDLKSTPLFRENKDISSFQSEVGFIDGLSAFSRASYVAVLGSGWAKDIGFKNFDKILSVNGKEVRYLRSLKKVLSSELKNKDQLTVEVVNEMPQNLVAHLSSLEEKSPEAKSLEGKSSEKKLKSSSKKLQSETKELEKRTLVFDFKDSLEKSLFLDQFRHQTINVKGDSALVSEEREERLFQFLGLKSTELFLLGIQKKSPADQAGLQIGDWVLSVNGQPVKYWYQVEEGIQKYDPSTKEPILISVLRKGEVFSYRLIPERKKLMQNRGTYVAQEKRYIIGVSYMNTMIMAPALILRERNIFKAFFYGIQRTLHYTVSISANIVKMIQAKLSPRNIAGPITIGRVASRVFEVGFGAFIKLMALISINLGLVNLLPIPMLDGGHIFFFTIEGLKGRPISLKQMEIAQQVGFVFLILLIGLTFYNDILNLFRPLF